MNQYDVNVRAVVTATLIHPHGMEVIPGWEIYNSSPLDLDGDPFRRTIRCDQLVSVEAENEEDAIVLAKRLSTAITMEDHEVENLKLWVDEGIDVTLKQPEEVPSGPSM